MRILHTRNLCISLAAPILIAALMIGAGCKTKGEHSAAAQPPPPSVIVASVNQKTVPIYSEFVGQTRADETVELRARVEGILLKVHFKEGAAVRKRQLLFSIDKRPFKRHCSRPGQWLRKLFQTWPRHNNEQTFSRLRPSWPTLRLC